MKKVITSVFALAIAFGSYTVRAFVSQKFKRSEKKDHFDFAHVPDTVLTIALLGDSRVSGKKMYAF